MQLLDEEADRREADEFRDLWFDRYEALRGEALMIIGTLLTLAIASLPFLAQSPGLHMMWPLG